MIKIQSKQDDFIECYIENLQDRNKCHRFPNELIWTINTYLSNHFELYEYYFSREKKDSYSMPLSRCISFNKYLCFSDLDPSYIRLTDYDKREYEEEYQKHLDEVKTYEQFFEYYSMEEITKLDYIATVDLPKLMDKLMIKFDDIWFKNNRCISRIIDLYSDVAIHIGDHSYMTILSGHSDIINDVFGIIEPYTRGKTR